MNNKIGLAILILLFSAPLARAEVINLPLNATVINGEKTNDYAGEATIPIGNFTGDIFPEMAVSIRNYSPSVHTGRVVITKGSINGLPSTINLATQTAIIIEGENYLWTGTTLLSVPDLDNNNYSELLVSSGLDFYIINGSLTMPSQFKITDVGVTVPGRKFSCTDVLKSVEFGDFDGDKSTDMIFSGCGLPYGSAGIINLSKLPAGPVTINTAFFDGVRGKLIDDVVNGIDHTIAAVNLDNDAQTDLIFAKDSIVKVYINGLLKSTVNTSMTNTMVFSAGDMKIDGLNDFIIAGNIYPKGFTIGLIFNKGTWDSTSNLTLDGVYASEIKGFSAFSTDVLYIMAPSPYGLIVGDKNYSSGQGRIVILKPKVAWQPTYTVTTADQTDNTKIIGGTRIGTSVGYSDNFFGGIGCSADTAIFIGSNNLNQLGKSYVLRYKK